MRERLNLAAMWSLAFALCAASILLSVAHAQTGQSATITCDPPTKYTDGVAIPAGTVFTFTLYGGLKGATKIPLATSTTCRFLRENLAAGEQQWYVTAGASYMGSPVLESPPSAIVIKVIIDTPIDTDGDGVPDTADACPTVKGTLANGCNPAPPAPPVNVAVTAATAYEVRPGATTGTYVATRIGVVPLGTPCTLDTRKVGTVTYNRIDPKAVDLVNWPVKVPPQDVFALCASG